MGNIYRIYIYCLNGINNLFNNFQNLETAEAKLQFLFKVRITNNISW